MTFCEYRPGLEGIPVTQSSISFVDGQRGILEYRGYGIEELAQHSTFLEVSYLLIWGSLPSQDELTEFEHEIRYHRRLKYRIRDMMKCFPESGHPMDALQACAALLDDQGDATGAVQQVRALMFIERFSADVQVRQDRLDLAERGQ